MQRFDVTRRGFLTLASAAVAFPWNLLRAAGQGGGRPFRIRAITAGVSLGSGNDMKTLESAAAFLGNARKTFTDAGYQVQTIRIATQPHREYLGDWRSESALKNLEALDRFAADNGIALSIGPAITGDDYGEGFAEWAGELARRAPHLSFTVFAGSAERGVHVKTVNAAAAAVQAIASVSQGGEGNFNFAATAFAPPGTPFFPAAWHRGEPAFAIGLESPGLLAGAFEDLPGIDDAAAAARADLDRAMTPLQSLAMDLEKRHGRRYLGIDASPAPGLDASIGAAIETLSGVPFGDPPTLSACAAITGALKSLSVKTCGYSGLMLPVLEDPVLARRAVEKRYTVSKLLLYSSVCGTGLDVVPLPGDVDYDTLAALIGDMASLAVKYRKPLSARLFPVPGKSVGEAVTFDNPYLTDCVVMDPRG